MKKAAKENHLNLIAEYAKFNERLARKVVLHRYHEVDGIVCGSDLMTLGAKSA